MPVDLLVELETAPPSIAGRLENIEDLMRVIVREVGWTVEDMKGSASVFENIWRRIVLDVAQGRTAEAQAVRQRLVQAFAAQLDQLKRTHVLGTALRALLEQKAIPELDNLLPEIVGMERLKATVFDRWNTPEDLEDLAVRDYPLTTADLDRIGPHCRPPASFYMEESKPF